MKKKVRIYIPLNRPKIEENYEQIDFKSNRVKEKQRDSTGCYRTKKYFIKPHYMEISAPLYNYILW